jgi:hypothetical protein
MGFEVGSDELIDCNSGVVTGFNGQVAQLCGCQQYFLIGGGD